MAKTMTIFGDANVENIVKAVEQHGGFGHAYAGHPESFPAQEKVEKGSNAQDSLDEEFGDVNPVIFGSTEQAPPSRGAVPQCPSVQRTNVADFA